MDEADVTPEDIIAQNLDQEQAPLAPKPDVLLPPPQGGAKPYQDAVYGLAKGSVYDPIKQAMNTGKMTEDEQFKFFLESAIGLGVPGPKAVKPIIARHASRHDFPKFDINKVSTGEGFLDEGHGLYFSQAQPTHKGYVDQFSNEVSWPELSPEFQKSLENDHFLKGAGQLARKKFPDNPDKVLDEIMRAAGARAQKQQRFMKDMPERVMDSQAQQEMIDQIAAYVAAGKSKPHFSGKAHEYEVGIHSDPQTFSQWELDPTFQSPYVQQRTGDVLSQHGLDLYNYPSMDKAYYALARKLGENQRRAETPSVASQQRASQELNKAGITGTKYPDFTSRANPRQNTSNIVMYTDDPIEIRRKWAWLGLAPPAGVIASQYNEGYQPANRPAVPELKY